MVDATEHHARELAPNMRQADALEVATGNGWAPLESLVQSMNLSTESHAILYGDEVAAIYGAGPLAQGDTGCVWMLTGNAVDKAPAGFLRVCRRMLPRLVDGWPLLINLVDARHVVSLRWLKWMGFELGEPVPHGAEGLPFVPISLRRQESCVHS